MENERERERAVLRGTVYWDGARLVRKVCANCRHMPNCDDSGEICEKWQYVMLKRCRDCYYMPTRPDIDNCIATDKQIRMPDLIWNCEYFEPAKEA